MLSLLLFRGGGTAAPIPGGHGGGDDVLETHVGLQTGPRLEKEILERIRRKKEEELEAYVLMVYLMDEL